MEEQLLNRRIHKRYPITTDNFVICHNRAGQIIDISESGMAIKITDTPDLLGADWATTFPCIAIKKEINGLPLKLVRMGDIKSPKIGGFATQTVGVVFDNPSTTQQEQLREHLATLH